MKFAPTLAFAAMVTLAQSIALPHAPQKRANTEDATGALAILGLLGGTTAAGTAAVAGNGGSGGATVAASAVGGDYTYPGTAALSVAVPGTTVKATAKATAAAADTAVGGDYTYPGAAGNAAGTAVGGDYTYPGTAALSLAVPGTTVKATATAGKATTKAVATATATGSSGGLVSTAEGLLGSLLGSIDLESVAGYVDDLLTSNNNVQYLDDLLVWLKDSNLLPETVDFLLKSNFSSPLVSSILADSLQYVGTLNTTSFFVALDQSGLAYSIIAGLLEDPNVPKGVYAIVQNVISSSNITIAEVLAAVGRLVKREEDETLTLRQLADAQYAAAQAQQAQEMARRHEFAAVDPTSEELYRYAFEKRDNIENLLTTIFSSVERSGLLNATLVTLLTDPEFQVASAGLISGALKGFASGSGNPTDLSFLGPVIQGLIDSGLLQHTFERALNDAQLRAALINQIGALLSSGTAALSDFYSTKQIEVYYKQLVDRAAVVSSTQASLVTPASTASTSSALGAVASAAVSSVTTTSATPTSSSATNTSKAAGARAGTNVLAVVAGLSGLLFL
ncbi:hypothetical protein ABC855_g173 [[Candida] zeylanoides]